MSYYFYYTESSEGYEYLDHQTGDEVNPRFFFFAI